LTFEAGKDTLSSELKHIKKEVSVEPLNRNNCIKMSKLYEEELTPKAYLNLTEEQKRDILKATPLIKKLGSNLYKTDFVSMMVRWKTPKYKVTF